MIQLAEIKQALVDGQDDVVRGLTERAVAEGIAPGRIVTEALVSGMAEIGDLWRANEIYLPEVLLGAQAMYAGLNVVRPLLSESDLASAGTVVIGTVAGDLHDIGKNLVGWMLQGAGFKIVDVGINVEPEGFVQAVQRERPDMLALSSLLTTSMPSLKKTIQALEEAGIRQRVKVIVGGAPVTQQYADEIGADGFAPDATGAVDIAKRLVRRGQEGVVTTI